MSRRQLRALFLAVVFLLFALPLRADPQNATLGGLQVAIWDLEGRRGERKPLLFYSHSVGGCNTNSSFLAEGLAVAGYLVVAPNHRDSTCGTAASFDPQQSFDKPELWTYQTHADRPDDFRRLLAALRMDPYYASAIDFERIGLIGYSLGGYVGLGVAGAWPTWKMPEIRCVLAAAPYISPLMMMGRLQTINVPVMYQIGSDDTVAPWVMGQSGAFSRMMSPTYVVNFDGANHFSWTDKEIRYHAIILHYARAFFDYVLKDQSADSLREKVTGVLELRDNLSPVKTTLDPNAPAPQGGQQAGNPDPQAQQDPSQMPPQDMQAQSAVPQPAPQPLPDVIPEPTPSTPAPWPPYGTVINPP